MKVRRFSRKGLSCVAAAALASTLGVSVVQVQSATADNTGTKRGIELGIGSWDTYTPSTSSYYEYVYFGNWTSSSTEVSDSSSSVTNTNQAVKWRILDSTNSNMDSDDDGMFLMSEYILDTGIFDEETGASNNWYSSGSVAKQWTADFAGIDSNGNLTDSGKDGSSAFEELERNALMSTRKTDNSIGSGTGNDVYVNESEKNSGYTDVVEYAGGNNLTGDYVFFLSAEEAMNYDSSYDTTSEKYGFNVYSGLTDAFDRVWQAGGWSTGSDYEASRIACYANEESNDSESYAKNTDSLKCYEVLYSDTDEIYNNAATNQGKITHRGGTVAGWWLRNSVINVAYPSDELAGVAYVDYWGQMTYTAVQKRSGEYNVYGYRPAMNLDTTQILFKSAAVTTTNSDGSVVGKSTDVSTSTMSEVSETDVQSWKLTLKDADRDFKAKGASSDGDLSKVSISYSGANTGTNEYVSAVVLDANDNIVYYQKLQDTSSGNAAGTLTLTLPSDMEDGSYKLSVFSEQANGDKETDYASALKDVYTFTVENGDITDGEGGGDDDVNTGGGDDDDVNTGGGNEGEEEGSEGEITASLPTTGSASSLAWIILAGVALTVAVLVRFRTQPANATSTIPWLNKHNRKNNNQPNENGKRQQ